MPLTLCNASHWPSHETLEGQMIQYAIGAHVPQALPDLQLLLEPSRWSQNYGAFAVVQADCKAEQVVLVRDHFGCEPLYYYWGEQSGSQFLIFGSNLPDILKQIFRLNLPKPERNQDQLKDLFSPQHVYSNQTFYQGICRVEPGSMVLLSGNPNQSDQFENLKISYFWKLDPDAPDVILSKPEAYLERFSELLEDAVRMYAHPLDEVIGELSGGLDSSAILVTSHRLGLHYPLVMHVAPPDSKERDDRVLADQLLEHLGIEKDQWVSYVDAQDFDPESVFRFCAEKFAGSAPYIFFMLANNVHQRVRQKGRKILLSGAGGDQCVSSHAPIRYLKNNDAIVYPKLPSGWTKKGVALLKRFKSWVKNFDFKSLKPKPPLYSSIRAWEWDLLQGPKSHEVRLRVEYSAVIAKAMGFEYRYPLLYPPLVEFCYRLPESLKRQGLEGRYLIRRYLERYAPDSVAHNAQKRGGIVPSTLEKCRQYQARGAFSASFHKKYSKKLKTDHQKLIAQIHGFMWEQ